MSFNLLKVFRKKPLPAVQTVVMFQSVENYQRVTGRK